MSTAILFLCVATTGEDQAVRILAREKAVYREDATTRRPVAEVGVDVLDGDSGAILTVALSASGVAVDPVRGHTGFGGFNAITARELTRLVKSGGLRLHLEREEDSLRAAFFVQQVWRGRVPVQRFDPEQGLVSDDLRGGPWVTAVEMKSSPLLPGTWRAALFADGRLRMRVRVVVRKRGASVLEVESVAHGRPGMPVPNATGSEIGVASALAFLRRAVDAFQETPATLADPRMDLALWEALESEGRWVLYRADVDARTEQQVGLSLSPLAKPVPPERVARRRFKPRFRDNVR